MDESEAISRLKNSDIAGLEYLVLSYQRRALKVAYLVTHEKATAEDVVQDAFIRVLERAAQFDERRPFAPWFMKIVINEAIKATRRRSTRLLVQGSGATSRLIDFVSDESLGPEMRAESGELRAVVWEAMQSLSPAQRALIIQRYYLGLNEKEIATARGGSVGTVKQLMHRAKARLRTILAGQLTGP